MTKRERVIAIMKGQTPDKVPWFGDLAYWVTYLKETNTMPKAYELEDGVFRLHEDLEMGYHLQGLYPFTTHYEGVDVEVSQSGVVTTTTYKTPVGTLTERWQRVEFSKAPLEHMIKGIDDLPALRYLYEHTYYEPVYDKVVKHHEYVKNNGISICYAPRTPFMELTVLKAGLEALTYCILDDQDEFEATLSVIDKNFDSAFDIAVNAPCDAVMVPENLSSEVIGKTFYHDYMEQKHKEWTKIIKDHDKFSFIHMDGTLRGLMTEVSNSGFRVMEALTPAPVGDVPVEEFAQMTSKDVILWGGLPGAYFDESFPIAEFDEFVKKTVQFMAKDPRYVLGVADQVPPYASFDRIKRVNAIVEEYGGYQ